nr:MAG TPA: hypothetical protein [Inoviridae sp.]
MILHDLAIMYNLTEKKSKMDYYMQLLIFLNRVFPEDTNLFCVLRIFLGAIFRKAR